MAAAATLVLFNGVTGAVADVALNDLSRINDVAKLRGYFAQHSILGAAAAAGLTVVVGAAAVLLVTMGGFGYTVPSDAPQLLTTLCVSFVLGCALDVVLEKLRLFAHLEAYYAAHGAGVWGGLSLVVSMGVALAVQAYVLPHLR